MIDRHTRPLPTCPDCGGILHVIRTERLTSVRSGRGRLASVRGVLCQCLLCGYTEARPVEHPTDEAPAMA